MAESSKRLLLLNMLYSFIAAALAVMIPLYLVDRRIDIASIGIILSVMPLTFMLIRLILASIADSIGTKTIGLVYSLANLLAIGIYASASTVAGFASGKFIEGIRTSGFWAIIRTDILSENRKKAAGSALAYFGGLRQLADGVGRLSVGFLIFHLAFGNSFILIFGLSFVMLFLVLSLNNGKVVRPTIDRSTLRRILSNRPRGFWFNSLGLTSISITSNMLLGFLIPLYVYSALQFSYQDTGFIVALLSILTGMVMLISLKWGFGGKTLLILTSLMVPALLLLPFVGAGILVPIIILAIGNGCGTLLSEYILADAVADSDDVSTDIGLTYIPLRIAEFLFMSLGGFIILAFGYAPLFIICAICVALFVLFARGHME